MQPAVDGLVTNPADTSWVGAHLIQHDLVPRALAGPPPAGPGRFEIAWSAVKLIEQCLGLLQIARVEAFSEPTIDRSEQFASLLRLALFAPEAR